ncbi:MAG: transglutaminase-like domain-containing protein [Candidatus Enterenecus sp.]
MRRAPRCPRPARPTAAMVVGDGLLLALCLTGVFFYQLRVYDLPGGAGAVLRACLAAAALALLVFSLPRFRWAAALAVVLAGLALLYYDWDLVSRGAQTVYAAAAHALTESTDFPGEVPIPDWQLAEMAFGTLKLWKGQWWNAPSLATGAEHFLTALIFALSLPLGWAVRRRSLWLTLLLTLPWLIPPFLAEFPPDLLSLSLVGACWLTLALTGPTARRDPAGGARLTLAALPAALLALCCVCLVFPAEEYAYPDWAATAARRLTEIGREIENPFLPGQGSGVAEKRVPLTGSEPPRYTGEAVLRVRSDRSGSLYLRGAAYAVYTGQAWERLDDQALTELETLNLGNSTLIQPGGRETVQSSLTVTHVDGPVSMAYFPYWPKSLSRAVTCVEDSYLRLAEPAESYTVEYYYLDGNEEPGPDYRDFVYEHYLDVPEETADVLRQWLRENEAMQITVEDGEMDGAEPVDGAWIIETQVSTVAMAQWIAGLLERNTRYDLQTPATPRGEDFVTWFLTESQQGYCVHYATAATLLLRLEGIPARYVTGYLTRVSPGENTVRDSAAHAWVEVYEDGRGWVPVEVTPSGGGSYAETPSPAVSEPPEETAFPSPDPEESVEPDFPTVEPSLPPIHSAGPMESPSALPSAGPEEPVGGETSADWSWLGYALAVMAALGLPVLYRALRGRRWRRLKNLPDGNRAVLEIYGWHEALRAWGGREDPRLEELAQKARFSQHALTGEERREALNILRREIGRVRARLPAWKRPLFGYLFVWK